MRWYNTRFHCGKKFKIREMHRVFPHCGFHTSSLASYPRTAFFSCNPYESSMFVVIRISRTACGAFASYFRRDFEAACRYCYHQLKSCEGISVFWTLWSAQICCCCCLLTVPAGFGCDLSYNLFFWKGNVQERAGNGAI